MCRRVARGIPESIDIPVTCCTGNIDGRRCRQITICTHELEALAQRNGLQLKAILEHGTHAGDIGRIEAAQFHCFKLAALIEHVAHVLNLCRIEVAQIQRSYCLTSMEHTVHVGHVRRIEFVEALDRCQCVTDIEHLPHVLCGACIPSRQVQGRKFLVPTEDAVEVRHLRGIEAAQIQHLDIIQIIKHGLHVRDIGCIQLIQSDKGCHIGKCVECTCGVCICQDLSVTISGNNQLRAIDISLHTAVLCRGGIPRLGSCTAVGICDLDLRNCSLLCRCTLIPCIPFCQRRNRLTRHRAGLICRCGVVCAFCHRNCDRSGTGSLLGHGHGIAVYGHRSNIGIVGRNRDRTVTSACHCEGRGSRIVINGRRRLTDAQGARSLTDFPGYILRSRCAIRPLIVSRRCKSCCIATRIGTGSLAAQRQRSSAVVVPRRRLGLAGISQRSLLRRNGNGSFIDLPCNTYGISSTIRPAITTLRCELCGVSTRVGAGLRAANGHLGGVITSPIRLLGTTVIGQRPVLLRRVDLGHTAVIISPIVGAGVLKLCHAGPMRYDLRYDRHRHAGIRRHIERTKLLTGKGTLDDGIIRR